MIQANAPEVPEILVDAVDGVRVIRPVQAREGDVTASLSFRVGTADEPVAMRGVSHLVEHLSLTNFESSYQLDWNGFVDLSRTTFYARGAADEVARFLRDLTAGLSNLPEQRVAHERRVLQVEAQSREPSIFDAVLTTRYGLKGPGRGIVPEWGLEWLEARHLREWVKEWFTSGNATLWSTAPLPGLELALPTGRPRFPELPAPQLDLPIVKGRDLTTVVLSSVVDRTTAAAAAVRILDRRLRQRLRHEEGITYAAGATYFPVSANDALVTASADAHTAHTAVAASGFFSVLRDMSERGVRVEELDEDRRTLVKGMQEQGAEMGWLDRVAVGFLFGDPDPLSTAFVKELEELRPEAVAMAARAICQQSVLIVPEGSEDSVGPPFRTFSRDNPKPVKGKAIRWRYAPAFDPFRLEYGPDGVTQWDETGLATTVRFDRCEGVVAWRDGTRLLYGTDGFMLYLDAQAWRHYERVRSHIDHHAPKPLAYVDNEPERDPDWVRHAKRWAMKRFLRYQVWLPLTAIVFVAAVINITATGRWGDAPVYLPRILLFTALGTIWAIIRNRRDVQTRNGWTGSA